MGHWYSGGWSGVTWIRSPGLPSAALPKDGCPLLVHWGVLTHTLKYYKTTAHQWSSLTKEHLLERQQRKSGRQDACREEQCVFFLSLFKLKRSANITSAWTLQISGETLVCRWMDGVIPPRDTTRGRDSVWTPCESDSIRTQGPTGP